MEARHIVKHLFTPIYAMINSLISSDFFQFYLNYFFKNIVRSMILHLCC